MATLGTTSTLECFNLRREGERGPDSALDALRDRSGPVSLGENLNAPTCPSLLRELGVSGVWRGVEVMWSSGIGDGMLPNELPVFVRNGVTVRSSVWEGLVVRSTELPSEPSLPLGMLGGSTVETLRWGLGVLLRESSDDGLPMGAGGRERGGACLCTLLENR